MAKLVFEEVGGDQFWVEVKTGEMLLKWDSIGDQLGIKTLVCGDDVHAFVEFITQEANRAQAVLDNEAQN
jgi:hypothetical protein